MADWFLKKGKKYLKSLQAEEKPEKKSILVQIRQAPGVNIVVNVLEQGQGLDRSTHLFFPGKQGSEKKVSSCVVITQGGAQLVVAQVLLNVEEYVKRYFPNGLIFGTPRAMAVNMYGLLEPPGCPICLKSFETKIQKTQLSKCKHEFHQVCLDSWLKLGGNPWCPLCRSPAGCAGGAALCSRSTALEHSRLPSSTITPPKGYVFSRSLDTIDGIARRPRPHAT